MSTGEFSHVPVVNIAALVDGGEGLDLVDTCASLHSACKNVGFCYVTHHGVSCELQNELTKQSHAFFALSLEEKNNIRMELGGQAWRGYFKVGDELTSGQPDMKEGLYLGRDQPHDPDAPPMHGPNMFPNEELKDVVESYMTAMERLGHALMKGMAIGLGLPPDAFRPLYKDPVVLFRIFSYPRQNAAEATKFWGVGEHTDYGFVTILKVTGPGLEVKNRSNEWIHAPPIPGAFIINIGDMLEKMTGGVYRSTPHRVRSPTQQNSEDQRPRLSFPFFFDPSWDATITPLVATQQNDADTRESGDRWDGGDVHTICGKYGDYLLSKVKAAIPGNFESVFSRGQKRSPSDDVNAAAAKKAKR